jgi:hypothetical protein
LTTYRPICWESGCFDYSNSVGKVAALTVASGAVGWQHTAVYGGKMNASSVIAACLGRFLVL